MDDKELFGNTEQFDTISRRAALNTAEWAYRACEGNLSYYHDLLVAALMDLTPARHWWIPCKTALPKKENTRVIIQTNAGAVIIDCVYGGTDVYGHHVWRDGKGGLYWDDEIVAWMPGFIPEPWKGEEK